MTKLALGTVLFRRLMPRRCLLSTKASINALLSSAAVADAGGEAVPLATNSSAWLTGVPLLDRATPTMTTASSVMATADARVHLDLVDTATTPLTPM